MRAETLHLTLAFLGRTDPEEIPRLLELGETLASAAAPFVLRFDRGAYWRHNRIYWAGSGEAPAALSTLVTGLRDALANQGFPREQHPFVPHLTLLRNMPPPAEAPALPEVFVQRVADWRLVESLNDDRGPRYRPLGRWPFGRGLGGQ